MSEKRARLADAVHGAARSKRPSSIVPGADADVGETKGVLIRLPADLHRELRQLALDDGTTLQAMGVAALQRLLNDRRR